MMLSGALSRATKKNETPRLVRAISPTFLTGTMIARGYLSKVFDCLPKTSQDTLTFPDLATGDVTSWALVYPLSYFLGHTYFPGKKKVTDDEKVTCLAEQLDELLWKPLNNPELKESFFSALREVSDKRKEPLPREIGSDMNRNLCYSLVWTETDWIVETESSLISFEAKLGSGRFNDDKKTGLHQLLKVALETLLLSILGEKKRAKVVLVTEESFVAKAGWNKTVQLGSGDELLWEIIGEVCMNQGIPEPMRVKEEDGQKHIQIDTIFYSDLERIHESIVEAIQLREVNKTPKKRGARMENPNSGQGLVWKDPIGPFETIEDAKRECESILCSPDAIRLDLDTMLIWAEGTKNGIMVRVGPKAKKLLGDRWGERIFPPKTSESSP